MDRRNVATTSTGSSNTIASSTKRTIQQLVPTNSIKKGPHAIERAVDPKDLVINRRPDEGSKPLFERDDISNNWHPSNDFTISPVKIAHRRRRSKTSSRSSNTEQCTQRDPSCSSQTTSTKAKLKNLKRRSSEKVPYFLDEKREEERLIRSSRSRLPSKNFTTLVKSTSTSTSFQKYKHSKQQSFSHDRHFARSRHRSPHETERQRHRSLSSEHRTRRHRRSKSRSRSRSNSNDRHKLARSTERHGGREHEAAKPTTQIIAIPVPVDPYGYPAAYAAWSHQPEWPAPRYAAPYPMPPVMPPIMPPVMPPYGPAMFAPYRPPPPYGRPYAHRFFRPPRFASRPPRGNFRPRNY